MTVTSIITLGGLVLNYVANRALIYGVDGWIEPMGVPGSGLATTIVRWSMLLAMVGYLLRHRELHPFRGARLLPDGRRFRRIVRIGSLQNMQAARTIDANGKIVAPGFIDIHIHGGGGHDFMDGSETAFLKIAETHARYGTTAMLPTTLTSEKEGLLETLTIYEGANKRNNR